MWNEKVMITITGFRAEMLAQERKTGEGSDMNI
jgi:hypothetical protein